MVLFLRKGFVALRESGLLNKVGGLLSATIIAIAVYVLYEIIKDIDIEDLKEALLQTDLRTVMFAAVFVALGYFTLTFYDLFALHTIGRFDVPYRIAALAGFTSYSIGHNVGASVFTGGAVRYRIYSAWGLDAIAVAKLCFVAGLTFWLGNAAVLGLGILYHPDAAALIDQLPTWVNRAAAFVILIALALYILWVWLRPRQVGRSTWTVMLPGGPLTLLQIAIGIIDLGFCALAMYMLVPDEPFIGFVTVAVIFVMATLLGFASHSPGGLGVFDAAMMVGLWQFDKEELLAGLLIFRALYYLAPFVISLFILAGREVWLNVGSRGAPAGSAHPSNGAGEDAAAPDTKSSPPRAASPE